MENIIIQPAEPESSIRKLSLLCLGMLFVLRIPMLGFLGLFNMRPYYTFAFGTYFFTALFIWSERDRLADFHIDWFSFLVFTVGPIWFMYDHWARRLPMMVIGIVLLVFVVKSGCKLSKITKKTVGWLFVGLLAGAITAIVCSYFLKKQVATTEMDASFALFLTWFFTQLTNAAIFEEPFFRGCLWGYMKKYKCKDLAIYLTQAGLFWIAHIYYINKAPYSFWIVVPLGGLVLGLLAWRSRSIGTSMVAHAMINGLGQLLIFCKF